MSRETVEPIYIETWRFNPYLLKYELVRKEIVDYDYDNTEE